MHIELLHDVSDRKLGFSKIKWLINKNRTPSSNNQRYPRRAYIRFTCTQSLTGETQEYIDLVGISTDPDAGNTCMQSYIDEIYKSMTSQTPKEKHVSVQVHFIRYMGKKVTLEELQMMLLIT